jgi:bifunctional non-homologous end joining protein LigD
LNGSDLRSLPLQWRKIELKRLLPARSADILYVEHTRGAGTDLYRLACQLDLEGIVAKRADSPYGEMDTARDWIKIDNPHYSQQGRRGEFFRKAEARRSLKDRGLCP